MEARDPKPTAGWDRQAAATSDPYLNIFARAGISSLILVFGIGVAIIPWLGTGLVVLVGWIPLVAWSAVNLKRFEIAARERSFGLFVLAAFSVAVPVLVYGFHLWIILGRLG